MTDRYVFFGRAEGRLCRSGGWEAHTRHEAQCTHYHLGQPGGLPALAAHTRAHTRTRTHARARTRACPAPFAFTRTPRTRFHAAQRCGNAATIRPPSRKNTLPTARAPAYATVLRHLPVCAAVVLNNSAPPVPAPGSAARLLRAAVHRHSTTLERRYLPHCLRKPPATCRHDYRIVQHLCRPAYHATVATHLPFCRVTAALLPAWFTAAHTCILYYPAPVCGWQHMRYNAAMPTTVPAHTWRKRMPCARPPGSMAILPLRWWRQCPHLLSDSGRNVAACWAVGCG